MFTAATNQIVPLRVVGTYMFTRAAYLFCWSGDLAQSSQCTNRHTYCTTQTCRPTGYMYMYACRAHYKVLHGLVVLSTREFTHSVVKQFQ